MCIRSSFLLFFLSFHGSGPRRGSGLRTLGVQRILAVCRDSGSEKACLVLSLKEVAGNIGCVDPMDFIGSSTPLSSSLRHVILIVVKSYIATHSRLAPSQPPPPTAKDGGNQPDLYVILSCVSVFFFHSVTSARSWSFFPRLHLHKLNTRSPSPYSSSLSYTVTTPSPPPVRRHHQNLAHFSPLSPPLTSRPHARQLHLDLAGIDLRKKPRLTVFMDQQ
jgi:hypothetical protein